MKYALNIAPDGRVLSVTYPQYAPEDAPQTDALSEGDVSQYRYINGEFVYDPLPVVEHIKAPTATEILNTLLGVSV